jgi:CubicO group peptidase (beta-lactamase class C family)
MSDAKQLFDALVQYVNGLMEAQHVPGVALAVHVNGETFTAGLGVTSSAHPLPVTPDTIFQIGSITKTYTAFVLMRLVEQGKLKLSDRVIQYVPDLQLTDPQVRETVTIEQLLTHTAGWDGDIFTDTGNGDDALAKYVPLIANAPQVVPNGTHVSYNNAGFALAGRVIEVVTGERYEDVVQKQVFEPLGLQNSHFFAADVMLKRFAVGHFVTPDNTAIVANPWPIPRSSNPAGGIACSISDLVSYGQMMLRGGKAEDGTVLLGEESFASLKQAREYVGPGERYVALSWFTEKTASGQIWEHGGGTNGQISQLAVVPEQNFIFAMTTNANKGSLLTDPAMKQALESFLGIVLPEVQPVDATGVDLGQFAVHFTRPIADFDITLNEQGGLQGKLSYKYGLGDQIPQVPPFSMAYAGKNLLVITDTDLKGIEAVLIPDSSGQYSHVRLGGRIYVRG